MKVRIKNTPAQGLQLIDGNAEMLSPTIGNFLGKSHEQGGTQFSYNGQKGEAFGNESFSIMPNGDLSIFGKQKVELNGKKTTFNAYAKHLAEEENKADKILKKASKVLSNESPTKWGGLAQSTGKLLAEASGRRKSTIDIERQTLAAYQDTKLAIADSMNVEPQKLEFANGGTIPKFFKGGRLEAKYDAVKAQVEAEVKKLYPNSKVEITMSGDRDISTQRGLKGRKASKTSVSLHNFSAAKDFLIYVDGKVINDTNLYKNTVWKAAASQGLHPLGEWDMGHISAVEEGKGKTFADLMTAYPELRDTPLYNKSIAHLKKLVSNEQADRQETYAYNQLIGKTASGGKGGKSNQKYTPAKGNFIGETEITPTAIPQVIPPNFSPQGDPNLINPFGVAPKTPFGKSSKPVIENNPHEFEQYIGYLPKTNIQPDNNQKTQPSLTERNKLNPIQFLPEAMSLFDKPDFVPLQQYNPTLATPYNVNYQDQINQNNSTLRQVSQQVQNNPEALSILAGQNYQQNAAVKSQEFRTNQEIQNNVYNQNVQLLNQAELQNLTLKDLQFQRQSQAKSNTDRNKNIAANSVASKIAANKFENNTIRMQEAFSNFRLNNDNQYGYYGPDVNWNSSPSNLQGNNKVTTIDNDGKIITKTEDDPLKRLERLEKLQESRYNRAFKTSK